MWPLAVMMLEPVPGAMMIRRAHPGPCPALPVGTPPRGDEDHQTRNRAGPRLAVGTTPKGDEDADAVELLAVAVRLIVRGSDGRSPEQVEQFRWFGVSGEQAVLLGLPQDGDRVDGSTALRQGGRGLPQSAVWGGG